MATTNEREAVKFLLSAHTCGSPISEPSITNHQTAKSFLDAIEQEDAAEAKVAPVVPVAGKKG